jgi:hypothetical protein
MSRFLCRLYFIFIFYIFYIFLIYLLGYLFVHLIIKRYFIFSSFEFLGNLDLHLPAISSLSYTFKIFSSVSQKI